MTSLGWGILGPGRIAPRLVRAVAAEPRATLTAVASRDLGRASAFASAHGIARAFGSYEELLGSPDVDVVYISLPNHLHAEWSVRALQAGKHVLCEKPLALTVARRRRDRRRRATSGPGAPSRPSCTSTTRQIGGPSELAQRRRLGPPRAHHRLVLVLQLTYPNDPGSTRTRAAARSGDIGCYPVNLSRRCSPAMTRPTSRPSRASMSVGVDPDLRGRAALPRRSLAQFDCGFDPRRDRPAGRVYGQEASLFIDTPFHCPTRGTASLAGRWRHGRLATLLRLRLLDQYHASRLPFTVSSSTEPSRPSASRSVGAASRRSWRSMRRPGVRRRLRPPSSADERHTARGRAAGERSAGETSGAEPLADAALSWPPSRLRAKGRPGRRPSARWTGRRHVTRRRADLAGRPPSFSRSRSA